MTSPENMGSAPDLVKRGLALWEEGRVDEAELEFLAALADCSLSECLAHAGWHGQSGREAVAEAVCRLIIRNQPECHEAMYLLGRVKLGRGLSDQACLWLEKAATQAPNQADYWEHLGLARMSGCDYNGAETCFRTAEELRPSGPVCFYLGNALAAREKYQEARAWYERSLALRPGITETMTNMANTLMALGRLDEALVWYEKAAASRPNDAQVHHNLAFFYQAGLKELDRAATLYEKTLALDPKRPDSLNNLGLVLISLNRLDEALDCFTRGLEIQPDDPELMFNLAHLLGERSSRKEEALAFYRRVIEKHPGFTKPWAALADLSTRVCEWRDMDGLKAGLETLTRRELALGRVAPLSPFLGLRLYSDPGFHFEIARSFGRRMKPEGGALSVPNRSAADTKQRIRLGYLSSDFRDHPVGQLMAGMFGLHDREKFQVHGYSSGPDDGSRYRDSIRRACDRFVDITSMTDRARAERIREDGVDILIDLTGHTRGGLLGTCAWRPAPIQVCYLGFLGTTGTGFMDYILADRIVAPPEQADSFSERFVYLPHCYQINDHGQAIADTQYERSDFRIPDEGFVFCSFNAPYKMDPEMFGIWMNILRRVVGSVLWLFRANDLVESNLKGEAARRGVNPERLIFSDRLPLEEHLARLKLADLILDTRCYNGGATTSNALWAGVPVLTMLGNHWVSRMSASALKAVGLEELIAVGPDDYEDRAVRLAEGREELGRICHELARARSRAPLFDTPRFVRNLETAYHEMWMRYTRGQAPDIITVQDEN